MARTIALTTDKAVNPNLYGATKLCEKMFRPQANAYSGDRQDTQLQPRARYGNVWGAEAA